MASDPSSAAVGFNEAAGKLQRKRLEFAQQSGARLQGFNEAAGKLQRKPRSVPCGVAFDSLGFNEAAGELQRKRGVGSGDRVPHSVASMRPPENSSGNPRGAAASGTRRGSGFNEAAGKLQRKPPERQDVQSRVLGCFNEAAGKLQRKLWSGAASRTFSLCSLQ